MNKKQYVKAAPKWVLDLGQKYINMWDMCVENLPLTCSQGYAIMIFSEKCRINTMPFTIPEKYVDSLGTI